MITHNFHQHSNFSDGAYAPESYIKQAIKLGFSMVGFTEHSPLPFETQFSLKSMAVNDYVSSINKLKTKYQGVIDIYRGLEMDFIPELSEDFAYWKNNCATDYLIGSVHLVAPENNDKLWFIDGHNPDVYDNGLQLYFNGDIKLAVGTYYKQVNQMIETQSFDVLGHMDKIKMHNKNRFFSEDERWYQKYVDECLDLIKQKNIIVEINTRGIYKKRSNSLFPDDLTLQKVKKLNIPIIISSDAHQPNELNLGFRETEIKLITMGFKETMFFNKGQWYSTKL